MTTKPNKPIILAGSNAEHQIKALARFYGVEEVARIVAEIRQTEALDAVVKMLNDGHAEDCGCMSCHASRICC